MNSYDASEPGDPKQIEETAEAEEFDVYIEDDRITVVKRPEPQSQVTEAVQPPQQQPPPLFASIAMTMSLLLLCYLITSAFLLTFFPPTVTVTLLAKSQIITATGTIQLPVRQIPSITLTQSQSAPATGRGYQDATSATGTITFYNGQFQNITVAAGTMLTGADGVQVITDQTAFIPKAYPPLFGQTTVSAHAIQSGSSGNIAAYDINEACCGLSVLAKNTQAFTGGQNARDFSTVSQQDMNKLSTQLISTMNQSMQGALNAQATQHETLLPLPCSPAVTPNHKTGDEAKEVTVTVSQTCSAVAYSNQALEAKATALLTRLAAKKLGPGYSLRGNVQVSISQATVTRTTTPLVFVSFQAQGTWGFAVTKAGEQRIKQLIAGKRKHDAVRKLLSLPGIQEAAISGIDDLAKLPKTVSAIHCVIIEKTLYS